MKYYVAGSECSVLGLNSSEPILEHSEVDGSTPDQGRAVIFHQLQKKSYVSVLGLEKCSGVDIYMAKIANFMIKMSLFQDFRTENTA